jgi:hypothetical protein
MNTFIRLTFITIIVLLISTNHIFSQFTYDKWQQTGFMNSTAYSSLSGVTQIQAQDYDVYVLTTQYTPQGTLNTLYYSGDYMKSFNLRAVNVPNEGIPRLGSPVQANSRYVYIPSSFGLLRSSDKGISWENCTKNGYWNSLFTSTPQQNQLFIRVSVSDSLIAFSYNLTSRTLLVSTDFGTTWSVRDPILDGFMQLAFDKSTLYSNQGNSLLHRSTDLGVTWQRISVGFLGLPANLFTMNGFILCLDQGIRRILRFNEQKQLWELFSGIDDNDNVIAYSLVRNNTTGTPYLVVTTQNNSIYTTKYYRSSNNGVSWKEYTNDIPPNAGYLLSVGSKLILISGILYYSSTDDGKTWLKENSDLMNSTIVSMRTVHGSQLAYVMCDESGSLYVGNTNNYWDNRLIWQSVSLPQNAGRITCIGDVKTIFKTSFSLFATVPILVVSDDNGTIHTTEYSINTSSTVPPIPTNPVWRSFALGTKTTCIYSILPRNTQTLPTHFLGLRGGIVSTKDFSSNRLFDFQDTTIVVKKFMQSDTNVYAITNNGIWISNLDGTSWRKINTSFTECNDISTNGWSELLVGTSNGIYRLRRGLPEWELVGMNGKKVQHLNSLNSTTSCIAFVPGDGVYMSSSPYTTWRKFNNGLSTTDFTGSMIGTFTPSAGSKPKFTAFTGIRNNGIFNINFSGVIVNDTIIDWSGIVSVDDFAPDNNQELTLYPNPVTQEELRIHASTSFNKVEVFSLLGEKVIDFQTPSTTSCALSLSSLTNGAYRVIVHSEGSSTTISRLLIKR